MNRLLVSMLFVLNCILFVPSAHADKPGKALNGCADSPEMVIIPTGSFMMGGDKSRYERPAHRVAIGRPFAMSKTEVTQCQWRAVMGNNPSKFKKCGDNCPVENVSWNDAQEYISKLNAKTGKQYRLPTEAEWEYACRAGGMGEYCGSDNADSVAWYESNSGQTTHPVARKKANDFGLYDMSGNVWEWVQDSFHQNYKDAPSDGVEWQGDGAWRVLRGGQWYDVDAEVRAAVRTSTEPMSRSNLFGFRLARTLP